MKGIGVKVTYRNNKLESVLEKSYTLPEYTGMIRADLLRLITDIEDAFYRMNYNKPKEGWGDDAWTSFCRIKHKLLDKAGEIERLPGNIFEFEDQGGETLGEFVAGILNEGAV